VQGSRYSGLGLTVGTQSAQRRPRP
jgi:hypothetical protein